MFSYTDKEFLVAYNKIKRKLILKVEPVENPKAYLLGGQPGSGKSFLTTIIRKKEFGSIVVINNDNFREYHPRIKEIISELGDNSVDETIKFASLITERLIDELSSQKYNLIIEGTLRTTEIPLRTNSLLKQRGYRTELSVIAVNPLLSYIGTMMRYEKMLASGVPPRHTSKENHDKVVTAIEANLQTIYEQKAFDNITIYNRNGECLYNTADTPTDNPSTTIHSEFTRELNTKEIESYQHQCEIIIEMMQERRAPKALIDKIKLMKA